MGGGGGGVRCMDSILPSYPCCILERIGKEVLPCDQADRYVVPGGVHQVELILHRSASLVGGPSWMYSLVGGPSWMYSLVGGPSWMYFLVGGRSWIPALVAAHCPPLVQELLCSLSFKQPIQTSVNTNWTGLLCHHQVWCRLAHMNDVHPAVWWISLPVGTAHWVGWEIRLAFIVSHRRILSLAFKKTHQVT